MRNLKKILVLAMMITLAVTLSSCKLVNAFIGLGDMVFGLYGEEELTSTTNRIDIGLSPEELSDEEFLAELIGDLLNRPESDEFDLFMVVNNPLIPWLTSSYMAEWEAANEITEQQARWIAMGSFIPTMNRESPHIFTLYEGGYAGARHVLGSFWGIYNSEDALDTLERLVSAQVHTERIDTIWQDFVMMDNFDPTDAELNAAGLDANRFHQGIDALYWAVDMLTFDFDFTPEELEAIESLVAWDYGRVAFIARYAAAAGFISEEVAWIYIEEAAQYITDIYHDWYQFTAAYIMGRALAMGNDSWDMIEVLEYFLEHRDSPFNNLSFQP